MQKVSTIADKIIMSMYKDFLNTGNEFSSGEKIVQQFPDVPETVIYAAIHMLANDGLLTVLDAEGRPTEIGINVTALERCDKNTMLKKGYKFIKEIRSWF